MADVALRGIPDELHQALKQAAAKNHRSLNGEILSRLETSMRPASTDVDALLSRIGQRKKRIGLAPVDDATLRSLREAGRP